MGYIYKITSPSNRIYVGQTTDLNKRIACHKHSSKKEMTSVILYNSIRKYGWDAHKLEVIEECETEMLDEREVFWIAELKTYYQDNQQGLNLTKGGEGRRGGWMHNVKLRKYFSDLFKGENGPFYGRHHTDENKKIIGAYVSKRNIERGITVPRWACEKHWQESRKQILCYGLDGLFVKEYPSLSAASKELNIDHSTVSDSLRERRTQGKGYIFKYKTSDEYPKKIIVGKINYQTVRRPIVCFLNSYILEYPSALEASIDLKIPKTTINRAAQYNGGKPIRTRHIFFYKDQYEQIKTA